MQDMASLHNPGADANQTKESSEDNPAPAFASIDVKVIARGLPMSFKRGLSKLTEYNRNKVANLQIQQQSVI